MGESKIVLLSKFEFLEWTNIRWILLGVLNHEWDKKLGKET